MNAGVGFSLIRISDIRLESTDVLNIFEGMGGQASVAAMVVEISSTVNELLFREGQVFALS